MELSRRLNKDGNTDDFVDIADKLIKHSFKDSDSGLSLDALPELIEQLESKMKKTAKDRKKKCLSILAS